MSKTSWERVSLDAETVARMCRLVESGVINGVQAARRFGISPDLVYNRLRERRASREDAEERQGREG